MGTAVICKTVIRRPLGAGLWWVFYFSSGFCYFFFYTKELEGGREGRKGEGSKRRGGREGKEKRKGEGGKERGKEGEKEKREGKAGFKEYVLFQTMPTFINWKHTTTVKRILQ